MKQVILINSPIENMEKTNKEDSIPPLGLGYIAAQLEKNFEIELLDAFNKALSKEEVVKYINEREPYAVTINIFTSNMEVVKYIIEKLKPEIKIIVGGLVVKDIYKEILEWNRTGELNIVIGEGEYIIPKILIEKKDLKILAKLKNKKVYKVEIESEDFPRDINCLTIKRDIFTNEPQINKYGKKEAYIITSRGCPYKCSFCGAANSFYNKDLKIFKVRTCNKISILKEIKHIKEIYLGIESIRVLDDLFLNNLFKINEAIEIFKQVRLEWRAMVHCQSFKDIPDEKYRELRESGCKELFIGIESGCEDTLKQINKERNNRDLLIYIEKLLKNGINIKGYFIYGFPNEKRENMERTYELFKSIKEIEKKCNNGKFETSVFAYRPYHGTELYNEIKKNESLQKKNLELSEISKKQSFNLNIKNYSKVSDDELKEFIKKTK